MATPVAPAGRGKGKPVAKPPPLDDPLGDIMKSMSATRAVVKSVHNSIQPQRTTIAGVPLAVPGVAPTPEQSIACPLLYVLLTVCRKTRRDESTSQI